MAGNWWEVGQVVQDPNTPVGAKARPDYGQGAYEASDGTVLKPGKGGGLQVLRGARATAPPEQRSRLMLALGPMVEAQKQMYVSEGWDPENPEPMKRRGRNPFNQDWGARMLEAVPFDNGVTARVIGGKDYQQYEQAVRAFESSILPIFSGAAVTDSEARRFIRANLPQMGDDPGILATKAKNRAMIANAAAELVGEPKPFQKLPSWKSGQSVVKSGGPRTRTSDPFPGIREGQTVVQDGRKYRRRGNQMIPVK